MEFFVQAVRPNRYAAALHKKPSDGAGASDYNVPYATCRGV
jgi:hypothetical protein